MKAKASFILMSLCSLGCASVTDGTMEASQLITFSSSPSNAEVLIDQRVVCRTPCQYRTPKGKVNDLRIREGHDEIISVDVTEEFNNAVIGNVVYGGPLGLVVDAISGRAVVVKDAVHVDFKKQTHEVQ